MWIDTHCHLTHARHEEGTTPESLINGALENGVDGMLTISCQISGDFKAQQALAHTHENVWCSIGTHPHDSGKPEEKAITLAQIVETASADPKIIGIGESGLDYYYEYSPREDQQESFRKHIRACLETDLPLIVHTRDAEEDTIAIMKEEGDHGRLRGVMHCFSGSPWLAEEALKLGFYLSFSGIVTFNKAQELQEIARNAPLDRILVETDAPFLAPVPYRGKPNKPAYVAQTGAFLAGLKDMKVEDLAAATTKNFYTLFNKAG